MALKILASVKWFRKRRAILLSAILAISTACSSMASNVFHIYSPNTSIERIHEVVSQIEENLRSSSERDRSDAFSTMAALATSARFRPSLRPPLCGCADPTSEFQPWSDEVLKLLRNMFEDTLIEMLSDIESKEAMRALPVAGALGMDRTEYRSLARELLSSSEYDVLTPGAQYYRGLGTTGVLAAMSMLPGENPEERHGLYFILRLTACEVVLPIAERRILADSLLAALHDPDSRVVGHSLTALQRSGLAPQKMAPILIKALLKGQGGVAHARALKCVPHLEVSHRAELVDIARSPDAIIRKTALEILSKGADRDSVLIAALQDTDHRVRSAAVKNLGASGYPLDEYVPLLINCMDLSTGLQSITFTAVTECERLGPVAREALPALSLLLTEIPHDHLRKDVLRAMVAVAGDCQTNTELIRRYWEMNTEINRGDLIRIIAMLGPAAVAFLDEIDEALSDPHSAIYRDVLKLCTVLGLEASRIAPSLIPGLHSDRWWIRKETLETIIALGPGLCLVKEEIEAITWDESWDPELRTIAGVALLHSECP